MWRVTGSARRGLCLLLVGLWSLPVTASTPFAWLDLRLNQQARGVALAVLGEQPDEIWLPSERVDALGLNPRGSQVVRLFDGETYTALHSLSQLRFELDASAARLDLYIDPALLPLQRLGAAGPARQRQVLRGHGMHVNYDILANSVDTRQIDEISGLFQAVYYRPQGYLQHSWRLSRPLDGAGEVLHLDSVWTTDLVDRGLRLQLGDMLGAEDSFGRRARLSGLRLKREFSINPDETQFRVPVFYGTADVPADVELLIDGVRRARLQVQPGPFAIDQAPIMTGAGTASLVLTNALGEQSVQQLEYYVDPQLLRSGLLDFDLALGWQREDYGRQSFSYGAPGAVAALRYGLNDLSTLEISTRLASEAGSGEVRARFRIPDWPVTALAGIGLQLPRGLKRNVIARAGLSLRHGPYFASIQGLGVRARSGFTDTLPLTAQLLARAGVRVGAWQLSYDALHRRRFAEDRFTRHALRINRSFRLAGGYTTLSAGLLRTRDIGRETEHGVQLGLSWAPDGRQHFSLQDRQQEDHFLSASYSYRSEGEFGPQFQLQQQLRDGRSQIAADYAQSNTYLQWRARLDRAPGRKAASQLGLRGAVGRLGGHWFAARALGSAYALVDLDGQADIPVYMHHRIMGRSNDAGVAVLPQLLPYERNLITTNPLDFSLGVQPADRLIEAEPGAGTGIVLRLPVRQARGFELRLMQHPGVPVPAGAVVYGEDPAYRFHVGEDGQSYLEQQGEMVEYEAYWNGHRCRFSVNLQRLGAELQPHIGTVACR